ncbi:MAG: DUF1330 domain-containing protein [Chlorobiota bacterium]|nr:MAG: DUF1330 domain-containing protein [Chlorobiota bacterium]
MNKFYLNPTQESGREFFQRNISGQVIMLNLLRFKEFADYSETPELAPSNPISGKVAYMLYIEKTLQHLKKSGGEIMFLGYGGHFLVGPTNERWDCVMMIQQNSVQDFIAFASNHEYLKVIGHRTAALEDSRLLPLTEQNFKMLNDKN